MTNKKDGPTMLREAADLYLDSASDASGKIDKCLQALRRGGKVPRRVLIHTLDGAAELLVESVSAHAKLLRGLADRYVPPTDGEGSTHGLN